MVIGPRRKKRPNIIGGHKQFRPVRIVSGEKINFKKEKKALPKGFWKMALYAIVLIVVIYYLFLSHRFTVQDVIVEGNHMVPQANIIAMIPKGSNLLLLNTENKQSDLLNTYKEFKDVQIYKGLPNAVKIVVTEYDGVLIWQTDNQKYLVNSQGKIIRQIMDSEVGNLPLVIDDKNIGVNVGDRVVSSSFIAFTNNVFNHFFDVTNIKPTHFDVVETTFDVNLTTDAGFYVKFDTTRASTKQLDDLKKILVARRADIHEYVDVRIDGWGYYK